MEPNRSTHYPKADGYAMCGNCRFFWHDQETEGELDDGECRRYPPNWKLDPDTPDESFHHPLVPDTHWCGEHSERPNVELTGLRGFSRRSG